MKYFIHSVFFSLGFLFQYKISLSQSPNVPLNRDYYHLADRYEILSGKMPDEFHSVIKPYRRDAMAAFFERQNMDSTELSRSDRFNIEYVLVDNWAYAEKTEIARSRKPIAKYFYTKKNDLFSLDLDDFQFHINPVLYFSGGFEADNEVIPYVNTRGLEASGMIAGKIGFYTFLSTTQAAYPGYVRNWIIRNLSVPYEGFWKAFNTDGVDYFTSSGYITFNVVKPVNVQFGHGKTFIGNGIRSMVLSDFSNNYLFLKLNTKVWKFNYSNLFAQNYADAFATAGGSSAGPYPKKFLAHHHLSYNVLKNLNIGVFENIVIGDSTESFDIGYLNPIIFYRSLEHQNGSRDNAMVGADFKWNFLNHFSLYGQFLLDEFLLEEVSSGNGWWANKYGAQIGLKYMNIAGIDNLDGQTEYNVSRPYTYAHADRYTNYTNYHQPLAHPLGANFKEWISTVRYQPAPRIIIWIKGSYAVYGEDDDNTNWGKNPLKSYTTREQDYDNRIGQGYYTTLTYLNILGTYHLKHNMFFDLELTFHDISSEYQLLNNQTLFFGANFRWNIPRKEFDF